MRYVESRQEGKAILDEVVAIGGEDARASGDRRTLASETVVVAIGHFEHREPSAFASRHTDLTAAVHAALISQDSTSAMRLIAAAGFPWTYTDPSEGHRLATRVLAASTGDEPTIVRSGCLLGAGMTALLAGDLAAARVRLDQAAAGFRAIGAVRGEAWALHYLAQAEMSTEMSTTGREHVARALRLFETPPEDPLGIAWSLTLAGADLIYTNELSKARIVLERAVDVAVEHDITHALGSALSTLGLVEAREGRIEQARALTAEGVERPPAARAAPWEAALQ